MNSVSEVLATIDYSQNNIKSIDYSNYSNKISVKEADLLIEQIKHLIDDDKYKPFYYKSLYRLGTDKFRELVLLAEKGKYPSRLFATLLKQYK